MIVILCSGRQKPLMKGLFRPTDYVAVGRYGPPMNIRPRPSLYNTLTIEYRMSDREIMRHLLPVQGEIARAIGLISTISFIENFCGRQAYIPGSVKTENSLVRLLGEVDAAKVINIVGGNQKVILGNPFNARFFIRRKAMTAIQDGWSINETVVNLGVSRNTVREVKKYLDSQRGAGR